MPLARARMSHPYRKRISISYSGQSLCRSVWILWLCLDKLIHTANTYHSFALSLLPSCTLLKLYNMQRRVKVIHKYWKRKFSSINVKITFTFYISFYIIFKYSWIFLLYIVLVLLKPKVNIILSWGINFLHLFYSTSYKQILVYLISPTW